MSHSFRETDFEALAERYCAFAPSRYAISPKLLKFNSVDCSLFDWGASCVANDNHGFVSIKKSAGGRLYKGPDSDQAHLSIIAFDDPRVGIDLLAEAKTTLRNRGVNRLVFGQDSRHFFPGCPIDFPALRDFLMVEGFEEGGDQYDVERDLRDYVNPFPKLEGCEYRTVRRKDIDALDEFFEREFSERWKYDVYQKIDHEGSTDCVFALFHQNSIEGFALLQDWECNSPIGGAVWNMDLGDHWGSLGPIGVSERIRGHGQGNALLGAALEHLRDKGVARCTIDWTSLLKFYGGHGFEAARTYRSMSLSLD